MSAYSEGRAAYKSGASNPYEGKNTTKAAQWNAGYEYEKLMAQAK